MCKISTAFIYRSYFCIPTKFLLSAKLILIIWIVAFIQVAASDHAQAMKRTADVVIIGKVTDEKNVPLRDVNVKVKNTNVATRTNEEGQYKISVADDNAILVFSSIGYGTREITVTKRTVINMVLKQQNTGLNEIVVIGYSSINRKDITGSIGSVNLNEVQKAPVTNIIDALAGRVAGVQVNSSDGQPGNVANIVIRGANSLSQSNAPLYVVDGFPLEDASVNSINPADIESMDILKDASATAIYGARGSNGVIVITTKKGKIGPPVVSFNTYYGLQKNTKRMAMLDAYNFVKLQLETNPGTTTPIFIYPAHPDLESYRNEPTVDLQNRLYQNGLIGNYDLAVRGGTDKTRYSISGNYIDQKGIIITSAFKRYQARITLDQTITDKIKVGITANYAYSNASGSPIAKQGVATGLTSSNGSAGILYGVWSWPATPGNYVGLQDQGDDGYDQQLPNDTRLNPIIDLQNQLRQSPTTNLFANAYLEYRITKKLTLKSTGGYTTNNAEADAFYNSKTYYGRDTIPGRTTVGNGVSGSINYGSSTVLSNENTLVYDTRINTKHRLTILGGATFLQTKSTIRGFATTHIPTDYEGLGLNSLNLAPTLWSSTGASYSVTAASSSISTQASFLSRVNYAYQDRYLLTGSFRADGSSKFSPGNKWGYFSSGAFAWRIINENFMKSIKTISDAKIRVGYGETGNNRVGDFDYLPRLGFASATSFTGYTYNNQAGGSGATIANIGNPDLKWETTAMSNVGIDLGLFEQRIQVTADWYKKTTSNLLLNANVPLTLGVSNAIQNVGKMQNTGLEFTVTTANINGPKFSWASSFNISFNRNKLLALTEGASYLTLPSQTIVGLGQLNTYNSLSPYISVVGQPVGQMYGVVFDGLYQYADFDKMPNGTYKLKPGIPYYTSAATPQPGWGKYKDLNNDGVIDPKDYTIIGRGLPIHTGGFTNNFKYQNFDLNVFLQWSYGNDLINANRIVFEAPADGTYKLINLMATMENRWSPTNQHTDIPVGVGTNYAGYNSRVIEDGSYLRLKTVSMGYNLSANWLKSIKISAFRLYATAQNLYTWTKYSGADPDVSVRNTVQSPGFDYMAYPMPRTVVFGFNATF